MGLEVFGVFGIVDDEVADGEALGGAGFIDFDADLLFEELLGCSEVFTVAEGDYEGGGDGRVGFEGRERGN